MAGLRYPQQGSYCRTATAMNLLFGVLQVLLPCFRPGGAQGQVIDPIPNVVELWQAEEGDLLMPAQVRKSGGGSLGRMFSSHIKVGKAAI
ncbi:UNVERIFIED_CONTAM: hypothetical protein K2H54_047327 [Gekko kuhli]